MELTDLTITQSHEGLLKKQFSALELAKVFFDRIKEENKKINAVLTLCEDRALSQAKSIDDLLSQKRELPPLAGIPCLVKDNILVKDVRATAGSKILESYIAPYSATCVKLLENQGVVILGKANLDEFAMGASGEYSAFGKTLNPHDPDRVPGGSSSGPAAAVAANFSVFSLGSDTGGSIRFPATFCGVVGFKPTYGAVSRYGLIAMASSLDQIGPLTKTVEDAKIVFKAIQKKDEMYSTSLEVPEISSQKTELRGLKVGVPKEYFSLTGKGQIKGIDSAIEERTFQAIKKFEEAGAEIKEVSLPHTKYALATYYIIMPSEVSANLARYEAIKYGRMKERVKNLLDYYLKAREEGFGEEVRRRIMLGTYALSSGFYEDYYLKAQKVRTLIREDFNRVFREADVILTPPSPTLPFKFGEKTDDPLAMYLSDIFMIAVNLAGLPAITFPIGKTKGLPVGLQLIGKGFQDYQLLEVAHNFEKIERSSPSGRI